MINKIVYVLGAGASSAAGLPIQSRLLYEIMSLNKENLPKIDFLSETKMQSTLLSGFTQFENSRRNLAEFIIKNFSSKFEYITLYQEMIDGISYKIYDSDENKFNNIYQYIKDYNLPMEDLFTIIDKAIITKSYFKDYTTEELEVVLKSLHTCLIYILTYKISINEVDNPFRVLCEHFVKTRTSVPQCDDNISVITLNWDVLVEHYVGLITNNFKNLMIDYCFYDHNLYTNIPSLAIKHRGIYNLKLLKLHGSTNWLKCSSCQRIYTDYNIEFSLLSSQYSKDYICKYCKDNNRRYMIMSELITPTFIKDLNSLQLKGIWHNAELDLSSANEIIFIGYSLPDADFELRYLLKKNIREDAKIKVILHKTDSPEVYNSMISYLNDADKISIRRRLNIPEDRYKALFSGYDITFNYDGLEGYLKK